MVVGLLGSCAGRSVRTRQLYFTSWAKRGERERGELRRFFAAGCGRGFLLHLVLLHARKLTPEPACRGLGLLERMRSTRNKTNERLRPCVFLPNGRIATSVSSRRVTRAGASKLFFFILARAIFLFLRTPLDHLRRSASSKRCSSSDSIGGE